MQKTGKNVEVYMNHEATLVLAEKDAIHFTHLSESERLRLLVDHPTKHDLR